MSSRSTFIMFRLDSKNLLRFSDTKIVTEKQRSGEELKFSKDNKKGLSLDVIFVSIVLLEALTSLLLLM